MPWFNVDDGFHSHPKAIAAGPAALGLWVLAGSWSAKHLTEGFIPSHALARLAPNSHQTRAANQLVEVGLWDRVDGGYQFHEWDERNPSKESVEQARRANRDRQARFRDRKSNGVTNASVTPSVTPSVTLPTPLHSYIGVDVVTEPAGRHRQRPVENPYPNGQSRPGDSPAGRHPSARPLPAALAAAGVNGKPADDDTITRIAALARQAITQEGTHHDQPA